MNPEPGDLEINASGLQVVDVLSDSSRRMTKLRDGWEKAVDNLLRLKPAEIQRAGLNPEEISRLAALKAEKERIGKLRPAAEKLVDILRDTDAVRGQDIALIVGEQAAQARRRADRSPERDLVLGPLSELMDYQSGPGIKAAATRARNAAEDDSSEE